MKVEAIFVGPGGVAHTERYGDSRAEIISQLMFEAIRGDLTLIVNPSPQPAFALYIDRGKGIERLPSLGPAG